MKHRWRTWIDGDALQRETLLRFSLCPADLSTLFPALFPLDRSLPLVLGILLLPRLGLGLTVLFRLVGECFWSVAASHVAAHSQYHQQALAELPTGWLSVRSLPHHAHLIQHPIYILPS